MKYVIEVFAEMRPLPGWTVFAYRDTSAAAMRCFDAYRERSPKAQIRVLEYPAPYCLPHIVAESHR